MQGLQAQYHPSHLKFWLGLKMLNGVGNITGLKILSLFPNIEALFKASPAELTKHKIRPSIATQIQNFNFDSVEPILSWADKPNRHIIVYGSPFYPPLLSQIHNPPLVLFCLGKADILSSPQVAVVGTRKPTPQGQTNTQSFCSSLTDLGLTVTSGLADGIDGEAHRAALAAKGYTIAVTGTGLNRVYPHYHRELAHQIAESGALISEKLPDEPIDRGSFPQRNRIIAGLSLATLVVEAANKSGSLITAQHAMEEGREVYAIPGSIHNPQAKGCHKLIKQGAKLTESIEDILEDLPHIKQNHPNSQPCDKPELNHETAEFLKHIDYEITPLDLIVSRSQLTVEAVTNKLLLLELDGWIINSTGGYIRQ
jgi:DNA processing protein